MEFLEPAKKKVRSEESSKPAEGTTQTVISDIPPGYILTDKLNITEWHLADVPQLGKTFQSANISNHMRATKTASGQAIEYNQLISEDDLLLYNIVRTGQKKNSSKVFIRAGPREFCHFDPSTVCAAIVTCGGLCPGLNNVIREIVHSLNSLYGCENILGIRGGFGGFFDSTLKPIKLDFKFVESIHEQGGTVLGSARGGFDLEKILTFIIEHNVNQLYIVGGDGTHRAAHKIAMECIRRGLNVSVAGIPKTIDNDIGLIDRSFGFQTAVEAAQLAIKAAHVEAQCNIPRGIGIVKLMGRSSGFIATHATLSSNDVDLCLVPEVPIAMQGEHSILSHLRNRVLEKGHAVVVVAEGAGEELLGRSTETDAGGNRKLPQIGNWIKEEIEKYFNEEGMPATVKYIDPSYMIRSVPANAADSLYCSVLAQNAVHGAMAGYTGFSVGMMNNRLVYIPMPVLTMNSPKALDGHGRTWERVLSVTRQPNTVPAIKPGEKVATDKTII